MRCRFVWMAGYRERAFRVKVIVLKVIAVWKTLGFELYEYAEGGF